MAAYYDARRFAQALTRGDGRIVLISSITANLATVGLAPYSATKAAVVQMARVLSREWVRKGINVNAVLPGYIQTEISGDWFETEPGAQQVAAFPRRRLQQPADLDAMILYLCADASMAVTGAAFTVDDGQSLLSFANRRRPERLNAKTGHHSDDQLRLQPSCRVAENESASSPRWGSAAQSAQGDPPAYVVGGEMIMRFRTA